MSASMGIISVLTASALMVLCTAEELGAGLSRDQLDVSWPSDASYPSPDKRAFGKLKFGKRPFGSIKFGKRLTEDPLHKDAYSHEDLDQNLPDPSKRYSDMLDNLYFQSLINNLKTPDDVMWSKRNVLSGGSNNMGDKRGMIKFGKKSFGPIENALLTAKEADLKDVLKSKYQKQPYTPF